MGELNICDRKWGKSSSDMWRILKDRERKKARERELIKRIGEDILVSEYEKKKVTKSRKKKKKKNIEIKTRRIRR